MENLKQAIGAAARRYGWEERLSTEKAEDALLSQIPEEIRSRIVSVRISEKAPDKGVCYIRLNSAAARSELNLSLPRIIAETNRICGQTRISAVRLS